jgi:ApbE superfamily uncharacterized protein (UPF0280 family)
MRSCFASPAARFPAPGARTSPWQGATRARFADGRWHFSHGPIDLIIGADGDEAAIDAAVERAWDRFQRVLTELVRELKLLRSPVQEAASVRGPVARRMVDACWPHREQFITPMAAVAGAVADELIGFFAEDASITRAYVNNGGDIALHLGQGQRYRVGLYADLGRIERREASGLDGDFEVTAETRARGVATSGWRGRSFSLGIADSVTVLAATAAEADAAATMIANSVNVDDPVILRRPANALKDDTDLGERLVTVQVGGLCEDKIAEALQRGVAHAQQLHSAGIVQGAVLWLHGSVRVVGWSAEPLA